MILKIHFVMLMIGQNNMIDLKSFLLNKNSGITFSFLTPIYFLTLIFMAIILLLILINEKKIINCLKNNEKKFRIIIGTFLLLAYILRRGTFILFGFYNWRFHLDINFCSFVNILFIIYCFSGNKKLYTLCYYMVFIGPFFAIIFPSISSSIFNYSFLNFIIIHHFIFIFNYLFLQINDIKFSIKQIIKVNLFIMIFVMGTYIFNYIFGTSYNLFYSFISSKLLNIGIFNSILENKILSILSLLFLNYIGVLVAIFCLKWTIRKKELAM